VAPAFVPDRRTDDAIGVWLQIRDDDFGNDDTGDINPYDRHTSLPIAYRLGTTVQHLALYGARLRGRLPLDNGDSARLTYRLSTFAVANPPPLPASTTPLPEPPPPPPSEPPPPGPKPDLIISSFTGSDFTVKDQGSDRPGRSA
jgi:hypothetical protein